MTVRTAEISMAIFLAICSILLMIKSADNDIGWVTGTGPGAGFWPFWMSAGMFATSVWTALRWVRKITPESTNEEPFMSRSTTKIIGTTVAALFLLILGSQIIGMYFSVAIFLVFYVRILGRHNWLTTILFTIGAVVFMFCFFEWAMTIPLPKGISEPLFYPLYNLIY